MTHVINLRTSRFRTYVLAWELVKLDLFIDYSTRYFSLRSYNSYSKSTGLLIIGNEAHDVTCHLEEIKHNEESSSYRQMEGNRTNGITTSDYQRKEHRNRC